MTFLFFKNKHTRTRGGKVLFNWNMR